ncbi:MAG: hypothetical protein HFI68_01710 [Lachnospiraceae bacterium]|nr:hypothetical protein [Lachnospiraceae bacterium]
MKKLLFPFCTLCLFLLCILQPSKAVAGAAAGLSLWYCTVLPTLLPCMILSSYLISSELVYHLPPAPLTLVTGWFCGYPMGAKTVADLWKSGGITEKEGTRLLLLCCMPSPMFLTGFLCFGMLRLSLTKALPFLAALYLPPVLFWLPLRLREGKVARRISAIPTKENKPLQIFLNFETAMMEGFLIVAKIGGYLMLFTMLSYFFRSWIRNPFLSSLIPGFLEMTSGIAFTVQSCLSSPLTIALCFSFAAFGGLSGVAQTASVLKSTPFSGRRYLFWKLAQAVLTFGLVILLASCL